MAYYLGLDIGTNSVGWAVTDENFKVVKKGGKSLWGARLFEEAEDKSARRQFRSNRRRLQRRKERLCLLQGIFQNEIDKVDPTFFIRLNESSFKEEDRTLVGKYSLFNDNNKTDKDFYNDDNKRTIYHLRKYLMETKDKADIREIYLAFHHMVKYRGNFLQEGKKISGNGMSVESLKEILDKLNNSIQQVFVDDETEDIINLYTLPLNENSSNKIYELIQNVHGRGNICSALATLFGKKNNNLILKLIVGYKINPKDLFCNDEYSENDAIEFSSVKFIDEIYPSLTSTYTEDEVCLIEAAKQLFDSITIIQLLNGKKSLSAAMVSKYDLHQSQLNEFKNYVRHNFSKEEYNKMFVDVPKEPHKEGNYTSYIGSTITRGVKKTCAHSPKDIFYKACKKLLLGKEDEKAKEFISLINEDNFLPLLNSTDNGVLPYQLNENEMIAIIENQKKYYPFLEEKDNDGYITKDKIISLLTFKIPYYIGPLNLHMPNPDDKSKGWLVRKEDGKIYPWNFFTKVDQDKSAQAFIERMKNTCTYLTGEPTLAKNSLLYSEYMVLSEVNKIKINGNSITYEQKQDLIENMFKKHKKVTLKGIGKYFKSITGEDVTISNSKTEDQEIKSSLSSYVDFTNIFGDDFDKYKDIIDDIILDITLFEDKRILVKRLKEVYKLNDEYVAKIKGLTYSGYGSLSHKLLDGVRVEVVNTGTADALYLSIIELMRKTNLNLMEIINTYGFKDKFNEINNTNPLTKEELIQESYLSPIMKRAVNQSFRIIDEIQDNILKCKIDKYFVECTRGPINNKMVPSARRNDLLLKYKEAEKINNDYMISCVEKNEKILSNLKDGQYTLTNDALRKEKIFLYFQQLGHCAYTGEEIDFESVLDNNYCDVDHIIPQALVKDDSMANKVLVLRGKNNLKRDTYPIDDSILTSKGKSFIYNLKSMKLMSADKYNRIVRKEPLTDDEVFSFVNRQLTSTNQSVAVVCDILKKTYCKDNPRAVVYSKAGNVSDFRNKYGLLKSRLTNDVHHAQDAYLNVVVGECFNAKYGFEGDNIKRIYARKKNGNSKETLNSNKLFNTDIYKEENGSKRLIWNTEKKHATLIDVKKQMYHKDALFTFMKTEQGGGLFDATVYSPNDTSKKELIPMKLKMLKDGVKIDSPLRESSKYGGFSSPKVAFYMLVKSKDKKGNALYTIEPVTKLIKDKFGDKEFISQYLINVCQLKEPEVIIEKLLVNTVIQMNDTRVAITGKSNNAYLLKNISQLYFPQELTNYVKVIEKFFDMVAKNKEKDPHKHIIDGNKPYLVSGGAKELRINLYLSKKKNYRLYNYLVNKMKNEKIYKDCCISDFGNRLTSDDVIQKFNNLSLADQVILLREILYMTKCDRVLSDYSLVGFASNSGMIKINKKMSINQKIIYQSVTGFFEKVVWEYKD